MGCNSFLCVFCVRGKKRSASHLPTYPSGIFSTILGRRACVVAAIVIVGARRYPLRARPDERFFHLRGKSAVTGLFG